MLQYSICAFLAPALVSAAAFPWAGPEPTFVIPAGDEWTPAPTEAPEYMGGIELFKRQTIGDDTCGYISGESTRSLTCNNPSYICATNSYYGAHGCCDPSSIADCSLPTTCIESTALAASCTGDCSTNDFIAKCTDSSEPYCYEWRYVYSSQTVMTEHGCAASAFTISVLRTYSDGDTSFSDIPSEVPVSEKTVQVTVTAGESSTTTDPTDTADIQSQTASPTATTTTVETEPKKKTNIGAIVGGVVGGLVVLGALAFGIVFLILRKKKDKQNAANANVGAHQPMVGGGPAPGVTEYKPQPNVTTSYPSPSPQYPGSPQPPTAAGYFGNETKPGFQQMGVPGQEMNPYSPPTSPAPQYSGPAPVQPVPFGIAEAGGMPVQQQPGQQPQGSPHAPPPSNIYEAPADVPHR
ncbi:hypothetical protein EJ04DRAFT_272775 [Polyplosphaeria fusca]|uniref:Uncharacterized protein n=1 Tax=Polyplosphaeria fusca TaxID=682080 RepID=A0A9P4QTF1_9PLEO|nr:hypothetical protein EJ04DRAFT_272775 [Polyplosphaeria fusca]